MSKINKLLLIWLIPSIFNAHLLYALFLWIAVGVDVMPDVFRWQASIVTSVILSAIAAILTIINVIGE